MGLSPVLLRPDGLHPAWGLTCGLVLQFCGVRSASCPSSPSGGRSASPAADRGLVGRGPYRIVRHPIYAAYVVLLVGYLLQSLSLRNIGVAVLATACIRRSDTRRERVLATNPAHTTYRWRVHWRVLPGVW